MKREITALTALSLCALLGCATRPEKIEYAAGPGPYAFDCSAPPVSYQDLNIRAPSEKLRLTGLIQVVAVAEHPDPHWRSGVTVYLRVEAEKPFVGLIGRVYPESQDTILFNLRWGLTTSEETPPFAAVKITNTKIPFELTLSESHQLTASIAGATKTISVVPFKVVRATLLCSGARVQYSNVVMSAQ
jgi:hypothetical protein